MRLPHRFIVTIYNVIDFRMMMVNLEKRRVISSMLPHFGSILEEQASDPQEKFTTGRKVNILRSFFRSIVGPIFPDIFIANPYGIDQSSGGNVSMNLDYFTYI